MDNRALSEQQVWIPTKSCPKSLGWCYDLEAVEEVCRNNKYGLTSTENWISRIHYLTLELMGHARISHQLALFLSFPDLKIEDYSLRKTGNRQIETFRSIFRGGAANLPIISANLTFKDSLCRINKAMQIKDLKNTLQKVPGISIQSNIKQKITFSTSSNDGTSTDVIETYRKPIRFCD